MHERAGRAHYVAAAICLAAVLASGCVRTRPTSQPTRAPIQQLRQDVVDAITAPGLQRATWGVAVRSLERGEPLLELNADALLVPASVAKLVTLATAADAVGWDYRFETTVTAAGPVVDGVLSGDLVIRGNGDPTIESTGGPTLADWVDALARRGLRRVTGRVVGDDNGTEEPLPRFAWAWDDLGYPYGALPGALNLGENAVTITLSPGLQAGAPALLTVPTSARELPLTSSVSTGSPGSDATLRPILQPGGLGVRVLGTLPAGGSPSTFSVSVGNPTLWFATILRQRMRDAGIAVDGPPVDIDNLVDDLAPEEVLHVHHSPPLSALAEPMMKDSLNLYAETVLWLNTGPTGARHTDAALDALGARLASWGVPEGDHQLVDGSGLSRRDTLTARTLVTVLARFHEPQGASPWMQALPVAGRDGTLISRLVGTPAEGNVAAKTGSMSNIRSLAGYVRTRDGEPLAFAIIANNFEGSGAAAVEAIDRIAVALSSFSRGR
jgi:D-alanyl-D-alanine carboxypeptidase/D-alanyl-D-alanine-endopeptidase (penicillin-binding protein 4)